MAKKATTLPLTIIIPIHNEAAVLKDNLMLLYGHMKQLYGRGPFEVLLVCNGCKDSSVDIAKKLAEKPEVACVVTPERGLGLAIREGIKSAKYPNQLFYAIDLPFGLDVIDRSVTALSENPGSVVIGSKGHPDSELKRSFSRTLYSALIRTFNNLFFSLGVKDTQGSILFQKSTFDKFGRYMTDDGPFFQAQILIYSKLAGKELIEIPIALAKELRSTRFSLYGDGLPYLTAILAERKKVKRLKKSTGI